MKITRIAHSRRLNPGKYRALAEQARRLGAVRSEVWQRYGSVRGVALSDRQIRDAWLAEGRAFPVLANAWKETLRDAKGDIAAHLEAAKVKARRAIWRRTDNVAERQRLFTALKRNAWPSDPYLARVMRQHRRRGHNRTHHQIVVRADSYTSFTLGGRVWIKIPGLDKGQRIAIPLDTTVAPTGTLRLIIPRDERVEVHYTIDAAPGKPCGNATLGVDKGFTEVFVDSDGAHHGPELGPFLRDESDRLKAKYQRRSKLRALAERTRNPRKRERIRQFNLGRQKLDRRACKTKSRFRDVVYQATHAVIDKAATIAAEDLTVPMNGRRFAKDTNRRLAAWTKGVIAEALDTVSQRRGSTLVLVNPAYTSQMDSRNGCLLGKRQGDTFHCHDGVVLQADENAARNVLARLLDSEIDRWTPYRTVKSILLARTERLRLGLLNPDSSCSPEAALSTESESPTNINAQLRAGFQEQEKAHACVDATTHARPRPAEKTARSFR